MLVAAHPTAHAAAHVALDWVSIGVGAAIGAVASVVLASLFQTRLEEAVFGLRARLKQGEAGTPLVTGVWRSVYSYDSADWPYEDVSEHFVVLRQRRGRVLGKSLPKREGSTVAFDLRIEATILFGAFREYTSKGRLYRGAVSFQLVETHDQMHGGWVGHSRTRGMRFGPWELHRETRSAGWWVRRRYCDREDLI